jgi:Atypical PilZ domain, cyclic di-GMP receptor
MTESDSEIGHGLLYEDLLPLKWRETQEESAFLKIPSFNDNNDEVLRFIGVLDEFPNEIGDEYEPIAQELTRVETKLNLLLSLVGQLVTVHFPLPPLKAVKLNPVGIEWITDQGPRPGDFGIVEIYLNSSCPRALTFPGKVERVEVTGNGYRICVQFLTLSASIQERLEKIIFRHHRRRVAMARRRPFPETYKLP